MKVIVFLFSILLVSINCKTPQEVWEHHIQAWSNQDIPAILDDYADDAFLIVNNKVYLGSDEIKNVFNQLFVLFSKGENKIDPAVVRDEVVYILWNYKLSGFQEAFFGTDSFFILNGKIKAQTIASKLYDSFPISSLA